MQSALRSSRLVLGFACLSLCSTTHAQFSSDFQTNVISGVTSNWSGDYVVGSNTVFDLLRIENGGVLSVAVTYPGSISVGYEPFATNNSLIVSGSSLMTSDFGIIHVGHSGSGNSLVVSNGATVTSSAGFVGYNGGADNNRVVVTGKGSVWRNDSDLVVGELGSSNSLVISDGGVVLGGGFVGDEYGPTFNNSALVTGSGSVWSNGAINIGPWGMGNSLVVSNGGVVISSYGNLGGNDLDTTNNTITVVGNGSLWQSSSGVRIDGSGNQLTVADGGAVVAASVFMFNVWPNPGNAVQVLGGSLIVLNGSMTIPQAGIGTLTISNGIVQAENIILANFQNGTEGTLTMASGSLLVQSGMVVGYGGCSATGTVVITGGTGAVTNAAHSAVLEVRSGTLTQTGGTLLIDTLVITNACGRFVHSGGVLSVGTLILDPSLDADGDGMPNGWEQAYGFDPLTPHANVDSDGDGLTDLQEFLAGTDPTNSASAFRITALAQEGGDIRVSWMTGIGKTNALQATSDSLTNFTDLFAVTNTVGSTTNYLDAGAVTNWSTRFYRVRLVP